MIVMFMANLRIYSKSKLNSIKRNSIQNCWYSNNNNTPAAILRANSGTRPNIFLIQTNFRVMAGMVAALKLQAKELKQRKAIVARPSPW